MPGKTNLLNDVDCSDGKAVKCKKNFIKRDDGYVIVGQSFCERCRSGPGFNLDNSWVCKRPGPGDELIPKEPGPFYPEDWVIIGEGLSASLPTRANQPRNAWQIELATSDTMVICKESHIPSGYTVTNYNVDCPTCPPSHDAHGNILPNANQIERMH